MYWEYFRYLAKHKWYVFIECCKMGIPIRGMLHDLSKFRLCELIPYAHHFYGKKKKVDTEYDSAWLHHVHHNDHHWQYWVIVDEDEELALKMPARCAKELVADWRGVAYAKNQPDIKGWYLARRNKIKLHPETRAWIEQQIGITGPSLT